jgi:hypothetical protein
MKHALIASFVALGLVGAPAIAATSAKAPPATTAQAKKLGKHSNVAGARVTKASAKTAPKAAAKKN